LIQKRTRPRLFQIPIPQHLLGDRNISHIHAQRSFARIAWLATAGDAEPDPRLDAATVDWLLPYTRPKHFKADDIMMEREEYATAAFYIVSGEVEIVKIKETFGKGTLLGEIGLFTPDGRRIITVRCKTDVQTAIIDYDQFKELYFQNPRFGFRLLHLVVVPRHRPRGSGVISPS